MSVLKDEIARKETIYETNNFQDWFTKEAITKWNYRLDTYPYDMECCSEFSDPQFLPSPIAVLYGAIELSQNGSLFYI